MPQRAKVIIARRAFEFRPDELRLTALCTSMLQERIGQAFEFEAGELRLPPPTFGPVPRTTPPGLVYNLGSWTSPDGIITPIRSLYIERRRVVITVASPTSTIDQLSIRAGAAPDEHEYYSSAFLDTDTHLAFLDRLEKGLTS